MDLPHEHHWQMRDRVFIVAHPGFCLFVFDEFNLHPGKLIEDRLGGRIINDYKLHSTHICARHGNAIHGSNASDFFDHGRNLLPIFLDNFPIHLISPLFHFTVCCFHEHTISLRGVVERVDRSEFVDQPCF